MLTQLKGLWVRWNTLGMRFIFALDPSTNKPSVTLLAFYVLFIMSVCSLFALHFNTNLWLATAYTVFSWIVSYIFYRIRKLDGVELDLKSGQIKLDADNDEEKE